MDLLTLSRVSRPLTYFYPSHSSSLFSSLLSSTLSTEVTGIAMVNGRDTRDKLRAAAPAPLDHAGNRPSRPDNPRACERPVTTLRGLRPAGPADPQSPGRMSGRSAHPTESPLWASGSGSSRTSGPVLHGRQRRGYAPATDSGPSSALGCDNRAEREPVRPAQSGKSVRPVGVGEGVGVKTSGFRMGPPLHARKFSTPLHAARSLPTRRSNHHAR